MPFLSLARALLSVARGEPFDTATAEGRSNERYRRIVLSAAANALARAGSVVVGLIAIPLALGYLGKQRYGVFATITALVAWVGLFDFGLLNGLLNRVAEAHGHDDRDSARKYFSSALLLLSAISVALLAAAAITVPLVPWREVLASDPSLSDTTLRWSVAAALACVIGAMPLTVVRQVYAGYQKTYVGALFTLGGTAITLIGVVLAVRLRAPMPVLVLLLSGASTIAVAANFVYMLSREMPWLRPSLAAVSRSSITRLVSTSTPMFLFQMGALLVNETQALILAHRAGLGVVTDYSVLWRVYVTVVGLIAMGTGSFVPSFREAFERGDREWLTRSFRRLVALRTVLATCASAALVIGGNLLLRVWLRRSDVQFDLATWGALAGMCIVAAWVSGYMELLNVMDRVWPQVGFVLVQGGMTMALTAALGARHGVLGATLAMLVPGVLVSGTLAPRLARRLLEPASSPDDAVVPAERTTR